MILKCLLLLEDAPSRQQLLGSDAFDGQEGDTPVRMLLLQAPAGRGKTLGGRWVQKVYAKLEEKEQEQARVPVFVSLPEFKDETLTTNDLMTAVFKRFSFGAHPVEKVVPLLQEEGRFLFILDGLDELVDHVALYRKHNLHKWKKSLFLVSCRTGFLTNYEKDIAPADSTRMLPM